MNANKMQKVKPKDLSLIRTTASSEVNAKDRINASKVVAQEASQPMNGLNLNTEIDFYSTKLFS